MEWDKKGKITVNRFDTVKIDVRAWTALEEDEKIFFGLYEFGKGFDESFIVKQAVLANPVIEFSNEETCYKKGRYRYQVKKEKANGNIYTVQGETLFIVV